MIACPGCGRSSGVQITRDEQAWERTPGGDRARWVLHCDSCGADWGLVDAG